MDTQETQEIRKWFLDDATISRILENLENMKSNPNSPIEWEFTKFVVYWVRRQMRSEEIQSNIGTTRSEIQEILAMSWSNKEDVLVGKELVKTQCILMRKNIQDILKDAILAIYNTLSWEEKNFIDVLLQDTKVHKIIPIGTLLLLSHVKNSNGDKKSQWIESAFDHARNMAINIKNIQSGIGWDELTRERVFIEFNRIYQEAFATIAAIGCHMYSVDCSVLMQPIKVKYQYASGADIDKGIADILNIIKLGNIKHSWKFFRGLEKFLQNPEIQEELREWRYLYIPLVVDAKDIIFYLETMNDFFADWKNKFPSFSIEKTSIEDGRSGKKSTNRKPTEPRVKFIYNPGNWSTQFNMRIDYTKEWKIEMDVGNADFKLKWWKNMVSFLDEQKDRAIIANSYRLEANTHTERIMNNPFLRFKEQMALIRSAMMEQGSDILWRDDSKVFWYHFTLWPDATDSLFQSILDQY